MYTPRNPFTPGHLESFTPSQYLARYLYFYQWDNQNSVGHPDTCWRNYHQTLMRSGLCCFGQLKRRLDESLMMLSGIQTGFWEEPKGIHNWLPFAWKRLEELDEGYDHSALWTKTAIERDVEFFQWHRELRPDNLPLFSFQSFKTACRKYGYQPDLELVASCFVLNLNTLRQDWEE